MMMKINSVRWLFVSFAALALVVVTMSTTAGTFAQGSGHQSTNPCFQTVAGTYAFSGFGTLQPGNALGGPPGPYSSVAVLVLDSEGNWSTPVAWTSYSGTIVDESGVFGGTYTVGDNCSVTLYVGDVPGVFAIPVDNGKQLRGMMLLPGTNVSYTTTTRQ